MRLKHIEVFYAAYTAGTVSKAAKLLNVSQPSVSKALRHAEDQLGFLLFERSPQGLIPTANGERLFLEIEPLHHHLESVRRVAGHLSRDRGGSIRIAMLPSLGTSILPKAIADFRQKYPDVLFDLQTKHAEWLIPSVLEGENEIGISIEPRKHPALREVEIGTGEFVAIFPIGEEVPDSARIDAKILSGRPFVDLTDMGQAGDRMTNHLDSQGVKPEVAAITRTYYIARELVLQNIGAAIVDEFTAQSGNNPDMPIRYLAPPVEFTIKCVYLADRPLSDIARTFIQFLTESFSSYRKARPPQARRRKDSKPD